MKVFMAMGMLVLTSACTGAQTYHCDFRNATEAEDRCQERSVDGLVAPTSAVQYKELCTSDVLAGDAGDGPCPRESAVAACRYSGGGLETVTDVYYTPMTLEEASIDCDGDGDLIDL